MARAPRSPAALALSLCLVTGCGIKEKIEQRVHEEVAEKLIEAAGGDEIDVETRDGKLSVKGKDGEEFHVDSEKGTVVVKDKDGKTYNYEQDKDGNAQVQGSDGLDAKVGTTIPSDFPLKLPAHKEVVMATRVQSPEGALSFQVAVVTHSDDIEGVAKLVSAALESKGLELQRTELATDEGKFISFAGANEAAKLQASGIVTTETSEGQTKTSVLVTWSDTSKQKDG